MKSVKTIVCSVFQDFYAPASIDRGTYCFWPVHLSLCLSAKNFNIGHNFLIVSDRAFIFYIYIPWGKILSLVSKSRSSVNVRLNIKVTV